jgi:hypothetical protein
MLCLLAVPLPPSKNPSAVKLNNNKRARRKLRQYELKKKGNKTRNNRKNKQIIEQKKNKTKRRAEGNV